MCVAVGAAAALLACIHVVRAYVRAILNSRRPMMHAAFAASPTTPKCMSKRVQASSLSQAAFCSLNRGVGAQNIDSREVSSVWQRRLVRDRSSSDSVESYTAPTRSQPRVVSLSGTCLHTMIGITPIPGLFFVGRRQRMQQRSSCPPALPSINPANRCVTSRAECKSVCMRSSSGAPLA